MAKVVVIGGGVGGLSAAQELGERGFEVVVIEKTGIPGGKARSSPVMPQGPSPWSADPRYEHVEPQNLLDPVTYLPGEHGFRFFPGFYKHVVDTMTRIPADDGVSAADHLVAITRCGLSLYDKPDFSFPARFPHTPGDFGAILASLVGAFSPSADLTPGDLAHFGSRVWQILTSCSARRLAEYEKIPWWKFIDAEARSPAYRKFLGTGITRSLVAAKAETASTRTIGDIFIQLMLDIVDPLVITSDRVLDGPTNQVWIYPWVLQCRRLGVTYMAETEVTEIRCGDGRITGVRVRCGNSTDTVTGDYYVCALPAERIAPLLTPEILRADPSLAGIREIAAKDLEWMNGVQFYFRRPVNMVRGHMIHIDTEWALTSISQVDVWKPGTMDRYGPPDVSSIVSVDVSDWKAPGPDGRSAMEQSREGVCREVWRQLKRSVNSPGVEDVLRDEDLIGWFIDTDIDRDPKEPARLANAEPLLVNLVDTWRLRPDAVTAIPNFFLASDYVRTHTDLATMEGANEAARRAVNGVLDAAGYAGERCRIWPLREPSALAPLRDYDAIRFGLGLPWDPGFTTVAASALASADPVVAALAPLLSAVQPAALEAQSILERIDTDLQLGRVRDALQPGFSDLQRQGEALESAMPLAEVEDALVLPGRAGHGFGEATAPFAAAEGVGSGAAAAGATRGLDGPSAFSERLEWYRGLAMEALRKAVPEGEPQRYLYEPIREFLDRPSKGLRPALCIATCRALGGRTADALPSAAGIEMLHNAFLVHDDIEDGSDSRRGRPTLHRSLGIPLAVNVGDSMNALAMRIFRSNVQQVGPEAALRIFDELDHMLNQSLEGQALELGWVRENNCRVATDDYLRMVLKKTAWYSFIQPMRVGAIAARPNDGDLDRFNSFGFLLGSAFQIQDDVLNLIGDWRYGKEIGGDLWEGKRTLPLIHVLANAPRNERERFEAYLARPRDQRLPRQLFDLRQVIDRSGSIEWARQVADSLARAAQDALPSAFSGAHDGPDLDFIRSLVEYLVRREV